MAENTSKFIFDSNDECLDFINTEITKRAIRTDLLRNYQDLVDWLAEAGYIDPGTAERMLALSDYERDEELGKIRGFRSSLRTVAEVISERKPLLYTHIEPINKILRKAATYTNLILINSKARLIRHSSHNTFDPHLPIAQAAAELLTKKDLSLVRKCTNPSCILFFYDQSKNHGRRWCSMERCGNRMKAALHYMRRKDGGPVVSA